jgi:hypothetical protein
MRIRLIAAAVLAVASAGCTPEWARQGNGDVLLVMNATAATGAEGGGGTVLLSDVRNPSVANDNASLTVQSIVKNPNLSTTGAVNDVILRRYTVRYYRADGRSIEGVDVPYAISGEMNTRVEAGGSTTTSIIVVRHQAKIEAPLMNLVGGLGGQQIVTMAAEISVFGETISGRTVSAIGRIEIVFADFANSGQ